MKKLDLFVVRTFIGPFVVTFFIALFVLVMQFLWRYVDDLIGKGLEWYVVMELLMFASASLVPLALPLAVLLSSLMTFGSMGEYYELTALKSSGISLFRIMRGIFFFIVIICIGAFYFSNNILPYANLKFYSLLYDIRQQKPTLNLREGIFYNGIDGYSIRANKKDADDKTIYDVIVYDHTSGRGNDNVLIAQKGEMFMTEDKRFLILKFYDGHQYQEMVPKGKKNNSFEQMRTNFRVWEKSFDLSEFKLSRTDESLFKDHQSMLNVNQLKVSIDTMNRDMKNHIKDLKYYMSPYFKFKYNKTDSLDQLIISKADTIRSFLDNFSKSEQLVLLEKATNVSRTMTNFTSIMVRDLDTQQSNIVKYLVELHRKFTLSVACLVFFFIGAPLGAIIRKGGLGMPLVVAVLFFIAYYIISISGEKFAKEHLVSVVIGMWLPVFILSPIGIFLSYKAMNDSSIMRVEVYRNIIQQVTKFIRGIFGEEENE